MKKEMVLILVFFLLIIKIHFSLAAGGDFVDNRSLQQTLYACGNLTTTNAVYTMNQSITASLTCLNITANNITVECNSHLITYSSVQDYKYGVYSFANQTTIKNCIIKESTTTGDYDYAIYLLNARDGIIQNNNITTSGRYSYGIYLKSSSNSTFTSNNITTSGFNGYGIYLNSSSNSTFTSNTLTTSGNYGYGIYLNSSSNSTFTSNNITTSGRYSYGIYLDSSSNNTFQSNILLKNRDAVYMDDYTNTFVSNQFLKTLNPLSNFSTNSREGNTTNRIDFNITMKYVNASNCALCSYKLELSPSEASFANSSTNELIIGNFTPTKTGIYSLKINVTDKNNNSEIKKYVYLINSTTGLVNYYFRSTEPTHGQPLAAAGADSGSLLFEKPTTEESRTCSGWVQFSPDILPNYLFGIYKQINYSMWYQTNAIFSNGTGIEKYATYGDDFDYNVTVNATSKSFETFNFTFDLANDYFWRWYWMSIKLRGNNPYIYSNSTDPSYANITYAYSNTPGIKHISNEDIDILSATSPSNNSNNATIVLDGTGTTNITMEMPNTSENYAIYYDNVLCRISNCTIISQSQGEINLTLILGSEHEVDMINDSVSPTISFSCSPTSITQGNIITCSCSASDNIDSSPTISYTANPATSSTGTFTTTCTSTDIAGNSATSSISYTVSSSGGGGGTPSFYTSTVVQDDKEFSEIKIITKELKKKERIKIKIKNQTHYIGVANLTNITATIEIFSIPQKNVFNVGDEKNFDVTSDDFYDIFVRLNSIINNKANLTVMSVYEKIPFEEKDENKDEDKENIKEEDKIMRDIWLVVSLVIVLLIVVLVVIYKYKKKIKLIFK